MSDRLTDYLSLPPWEALIQMVNDYHALDLNPKLAKLVSMNHVDKDTVKVTIASPRSQRGNVALPPFDYRVVTYHRLDIETFFGEFIQEPFVVSQYPATTKRITDELSRRSNVKFDINDFRHYIIQDFQDRIYLEAFPGSLRWTGKVVLTLKKE